MYKHIKPRHNIMNINTQFVEFHSTQCTTNHSAAFLTSLNIHLNPRKLPSRSKNIGYPTYHVTCKASTASRPRIVVLPGMDGSDLMLDNFRSVTTSKDDSNRVIAVNYPLSGKLSIQELADHVHDNYLCQLSNDSRGYILINQSFSGHVGFDLAQRQLPGNIMGQVFVNSFASTPLSGALRNFALSVPAAAFVRQPPPWMVGRFFLGDGGQGMETVQAAGGQVDYVVMHHRLTQCLKEDAWQVWKNKELLPDENTLYIRGTKDMIVSDDIAEEMRLARLGIKWVHIPEGPHLLMQRFGIECGFQVERFCRQLMKDNVYSGTKR